MPQMKPMNWLFLMIYFVASYLMIIIHIFFSVSKKILIKEKKEEKKMFKYNFMW